MMNEPFIMYPLNFTKFYVNSRAFAELPPHDFKNYFERRETLIIGDSHVACLFGDERAFRHSGMDAEVVFIGGATITGFGRRESTLATYRRVNHYIKTFKPSNIVFKFGQVDVDLGWYYRRVVDDQPDNPASHFQTIIDRYVESILGLPSHTRQVVCGINLPSVPSPEQAAEYTSRIITENITDDALYTVYRSKLIRILPSIERRTEMTLEFNRQLKEKCTRSALDYFDYTDIFIDSATGILDARYAGTADHHYRTTAEDQANCVGRLRNILD